MEEGGRGDVASSGWRGAMLDGSATTQAAPRGEDEVEGARKQGGGGWIWLVVCLMGKTRKVEKVWAAWGLMDGTSP